MALHWAYCHKMKSCCRVTFFFLSLVHRPTVKKANLPLNPTSNKHWPIWIARGRSSEQESACFQARILPVISETKVLVWLEKRSSCHGNRELSILLYTLVLTSVWIKASSDLEKIFFQSKLCPRSIWYGVWFSDQKLRRAKKRKVKVSQFAIAINTLTRPQPTHYTFSFTRLNWPFITRVPGVYLWLFLLSFYLVKFGTVWYGPSFYLF